MSLENDNGGIHGKSLMEGNVIAKNDKHVRKLRQERTSIYKNMRLNNFTGDMKSRFILFYARRKDNRAKEQTIRNGNCLN